MLSPSLLPWQPLSGLLNGGHTTVSLALDLVSSPDSLNLQGSHSGGCSAITMWGNYTRAKLPPGSTNGAVPAGHRADGVAGALGRGVQASFAIRNFTTFRVHITPFLGGFVADCYLGRYKTILYFSLVCLSERFALG